MTSITWPRTCPRTFTRPESASTGRTSLQKKTFYGLPVLALTWSAYRFRTLFLATGHRLSGQLPRSTAPLTGQKHTELRFCWICTPRQIAKMALTTVEFPGSASGRVSRPRLSLKKALSSGLRNATASGWAFMELKSSMSPQRRRCLVICNGAFHRGTRQRQLAVRQLPLASCTSTTRIAMTYCGHSCRLTR